MDFFTILFWLLVLSPLIGVILVIIINHMYENHIEKRAKNWISSKGKEISKPQDSIHHGKIVLAADPVVDRVDFSEFYYTCPRGRRRLYRLQVHFTPNSYLFFEMTGKRYTRGLGKVFDYGEGVIGIDDIDEFFWTETPMIKEIAAALDNPKTIQKFRRAIALYSLLVMGNRIDIVFNRKNKHLDSMYNLAYELVNVLSDLP
jgi:hypothetical protein